MKRTTFFNTKGGSEARGPWQHTASWKKQEEPPEVLIEEPLVEPDDVVSYVTEEVTEEVTEPTVTEPTVIVTETEETETEVTPRFKKVIAAVVLILVLLIALLFVRNLRDDEGTGPEDDEVVSIWEEVDFTTTSLYTD